MFNPDLQKGEVISNRQLMGIFHCACEGGIRYASKTGTIALVINNARAGRANAISGKLAQFAGRPMKKPGEMTGVNQRLQNFLREKQPVYLFEAVSAGQYRYLGRVREHGAPVIAQDENGAPYPVFQLEIVDE